MRPEPAADHLDLWRGIDDAVWREAMRATTPAVLDIRRRPGAAPKGQAANHFAGAQTARIVEQV